MNPATHGPRMGDYGLLLVMALIFGSTYMFIAVGLRSVPPFTLALSRGGIAAIVLGSLVFALRHSLPRDWRSWRAFILIGFVGNALPFMLMTSAQTRIDSSLAAILITAMPLFTLGLAHFFTDDRASPRKLVGFVIGFAGILMLLGPAALAGHGGSLIGQIMYLGVGLCYAVAQVLVRRLGTGSGTALVRAACTLACGSLWLLPLVLIVDRPWTLDPSLDSVLAMLGLGLLSSAVAHFIMYYLNATAGPNFVAANNYIGPLVGIMWGALLLGERITWLMVAAMLVIFVGLAFATTRTGVARLKLG